MRVLILGAATSGMAAARLARRKGFAVGVYDANPAVTATLLAEGFGAITGGWDPGLLDGVDLVITSPGFSERSAPIVDSFESGIPIWSEIELGFRQLSAPMVAVTGTNGKTTVTRLISQMLGESGFRAPPLGNIGNALTDHVTDDLDVAVVEVSSFQLRFTEVFRPRVAVVTNVAPDHLDWHGSFERYLEAKARIVEQQGADDLAVYDSDDPGACRVAERARSRVIPVSTTSVGPAGVGVARDMLVWPQTAIPIERLAIRDRVFLIDALLAGVAAMEMGATPDAVERVVTTFQPDRHRRTVVGESGGIVYIDDSKATNPHAALAAIRSFPSVVLIAGGRTKGLDIGPLVDEPNLRQVVAIGESADLLAERAPQLVTKAGDMSQAVEIAARYARPGDVVLLSPGCASFDMFESYEQRGDAFAEAVASVTGGDVTA